MAGCAFADRSSPQSPRCDAEASRAIFLADLLDRVNGMRTRCCCRRLQLRVRAYLFLEFLEK